MRDLAILFLHLITTLTRLFGPGGARSIVAESLLVKHQLLIVNRSRERAPNLRTSDRIIAGLCAMLMRPGRILRSAVILKPSTGTVKLMQFLPFWRRNGPTRQRKINDLVHQLAFVLSSIQLT